MPPKDDTWRIPSKLAVTTIGVLLSGAITFNAWAVSAVYARPTRPEVVELIVDKSPYANDRSMILRVLSDISEDLKELKTLLREKNGATDKP